MTLEKQVVVLKGWEPGFDKIGFTNLMQAEVAVSLSAAKNLTDKLLAGEAVIIWVRDLAKTVDQARSLGAIVLDDPWGRNAN